MKSFYLNRNSLLIISIFLIFLFTDNVIGNDIKKKVASLTIQTSLSPSVNNFVSTRTDTQSSDVSNQKLVGLKYKKNTPNAYVESDHNNRQKNLPKGRHLSSRFFENTSSNSVENDKSSEEKNITSADSNSDHSTFKEIESINDSPSLWNRLFGLRKPNHSTFKGIEYINDSPSLWNRFFGLCKHKNHFVEETQSAIKYFSNNMLNNCDEIALNLKHFA